MAFEILDPCKLPEKKKGLIQYSDNELQDLGEHNGMRKVNRFQGEVNAQDADIDTTRLTAEWTLFKSIIFEKHLSHLSKVDTDMGRVRQKMCKSSLRKEKARHHKSYGMISKAATLRKRFIPTVFTCFTCF